MISDLDPVLLLVSHFDLRQIHIASYVQYDVIHKTDGSF